MEGKTIISCIIACCLQTAAHSLFWTRGTHKKWPSKLSRAYQIILSFNKFRSRKHDIHKYLSEYRNHLSDLCRQTYDIHKYLFEYRNHLSDLCRQTYKFCHPPLTQIHRNIELRECRLRALKFRCWARGAAWRPPWKRNESTQRVRWCAQNDPQRISSSWWCTVQLVLLTLNIIKSFLS